MPWTRRLNAGDLKHSDDNDASRQTCELKNFCSGRQPRRRWQSRLLVLVTGVGRRTNAERLRRATSRCRYRL